MNSAYINKKTAAYVLVFLICSVIGGFIIHPFFMTIDKIMILGPQVPGTTFVESFYEFLLITFTTGMVRWTITFSIFGGLIGIMILVLNRYRSLLKEADETKSKFLAVISHDIRNPINAILGFAQLLKDDTENLTHMERENSINSIYDAAQNTNRLLTNLLTWARSQMNQMKTTVKCINLTDLIHENVNLLSHNAMRKNIRLISEIEEDIFVYADWDMVDLVLRNLITNALKFTNCGGYVKITVEIMRNYVEISIIDNGIGINKSDLNRLFKYDNLLTRPGTNNEKGSGLGLILCKDLIQKHGSKLIIESKEFVGSTFKFNLPITDLLN